VLISLRAAQYMVFDSDMEEWRFSLKRYYPKKELYDQLQEQHNGSRVVKTLQLLEAQFGEKHEEPTKEQQFYMVMFLSRSEYKVG
jgi:hypothetical protein